MKLFTHSSAGYFIIIFHRSGEGEGDLGLSTDSVLNQFSLFFNGFDMYITTLEKLVKSRFDFFMDRDHAKMTFSAGKTGGVLRGGASGANRYYVLAPCRGGGLKLGKR